MANLLSAKRLRQHHGSVLVIVKEGPNGLPMAHWLGCSSVDAVGTENQVIDMEKVGFDLMEMMFVEELWRERTFRDREVDFCPDCAVKEQAKFTPSFPDEHYYQPWNFHG